LKELTVEKIGEKKETKKTTGTRKRDGELLEIPSLGEDCKEPTD